MIKFCLKAEDDDFYGIVCDVYGIFDEDKHIGWYGKNIIIGDA